MNKRKFRAGANGFIYNALNKSHDLPLPLK